MRHSHSTNKLAFVVSRSRILGIREARIVLPLHPFYNQLKEGV